MTEDQGCTMRPQNNARQNSLPSAFQKTAKTTGRSTPFAFSHNDSSVDFFRVQTPNSGAHPLISQSTREVPCLSRELDEGDLLVTQKSRGAQRAPQSVAQFRLEHVLESRLQREDFAPNNSREKKSQTLLCLADSAQRSCPSEKRRHAQRVRLSLSETEPLRNLVKPKSNSSPQSCIVRPETDAGQSSFCSRTAFLPVTVLKIQLKS